MKNHMDGNKKDNKHDPTATVHGNPGTGAEWDFIGKRDTAVLLDFKRD